MKHYTDTIPLDPAEKLKEKGMPIDIDSDTFDCGTQYQRDEIWCNNTYAEVFDWLMSDNRQITIVIEPSFYEPYLGKVYNKDGFVKGFDGKTWHAAANAAIEKALELIK